MGAQGFNSVSSKRSRRGEKKHALPVIPATVEVFHCKPLNGVRITRKGCARVAENPPTIGPCGSCPIGVSHKKGRIPFTWPDGTDIVVTTIAVGAPLPVN